MANERMTMSTNGLSRLEQRERLVMQYYNDQANNCTYGVGTLAHLGPCTEEELRRTLTPEQVNTHFATGIHDAERAVRNRVRDTELTQEQFDALVSYTYNAGPTGASAALGAANRGDPDQVISHMNSRVFVRTRQPDGTVVSERSRGLINRRHEEAAPFRGPLRRRP